MPSGPRYGERVISAGEIYEKIYPGDYGSPIWSESEACEMHRIRGLVVGQATELEAAISSLAHTMQPEMTLPNSMKATFGRLTGMLPITVLSEFGAELDVVQRAITARNRVVHGEIRISVIDGGQCGLIPVLSLLDGDVYDEDDLLDDLALMQDATETLARVAHLVHTARSQEHTMVGA